MLARAWGDGRKFFTGIFYAILRSRARLPPRRQIRVSRRLIGPEEYDAATRRAPAACPLFAMGDERRRAPCCVPLAEVEGIIHVPPHVPINDRGRMPVGRRRVYCVLCACVVVGVGVR